MNARHVAALGALALVAAAGWLVTRPGTPLARDPGPGPSDQRARPDAGGRTVPEAPSLDTGASGAVEERAAVPVTEANARRELLEASPGKAILVVAVMGKRGGVEGATVRFTGDLEARALDAALEPFPEETAGRTDSGGEARFLVQALRMTDLSVDLPGGVGGTYTTRVATPPVGGKKRVRVDVLAPGDAAGEIFVREVDTGSPIVGARVEAGRVGLARTVEAFTDGAGRAELGIRGPCELAIEAEGYSDRETKVELLDDPVTVEMVPHARVWGRLELPEAFGPVTLSATWSHDEAAGRTIVGRPLDPGGAWNGSPGEGGAWSIEGIAFRDLRTSIGMVVRASTPRGSFTLASGLEVHAGESVELVSPLAGARFEPVRLRYPSGEAPVHAPHVELLGGGGERSALQGPDDDWNPAWLPVGAWEYEIAGVRLGPVTRAPDGSAELVLHGLGRIRGRVEGVPAGERPPHVSVFGWTTVDCEPDGTFVVDCLPLDQPVQLQATSQRAPRGVLVFGSEIRAGGTPAMPGTEDVVLTVDG